MVCIMPTFRKLLALKKMECLLRFDAGEAIGEGVTKVKIGISSSER